MTLYPKFVLTDRGGALAVTNTLREARQEAKRMSKWWGGAGAICITEVVSFEVRRKHGCVRKRAKGGRGPSQRSKDGW